MATEKGSLFVEIDPQKETVTIHSDVLEGGKLGPVPVYLLRVMGKVFNSVADELNLPQEWRATREPGEFNSLEEAEARAEKILGREKKTVVQ